VLVLIDPNLDHLKSSFIKCQSPFSTISANSIPTQMCHYSDILDIVVKFIVNLNTDASYAIIKSKSVNVGMKSLIAIIKYKFHFPLLFLPSRLPRWPPGLGPALRGYSAPEGAID